MSKQGSLKGFVVPWWSRQQKINETADKHLLKATVMSLSLAWHQRRMMGKRQESSRVGREQRESSLWLTGQVCNWREQEISQVFNFQTNRLQNTREDQVFSFSPTIKCSHRSEIWKDSYPLKKQTFKGKHTLGSTSVTPASAKCGGLTADESFWLRTCDIIVKTTALVAHLLQSQVQVACINLQSSEQHTVGPGYFRHHLNPYIPAWLLRSSPGASLVIGEAKLVRLIWQQLETEPFVSLPQACGILCQYSSVTFCLSF